MGEASKARQVKRPLLHTLILWGLLLALLIGAAIVVGPVLWLWIACHFTYCDM